MATNSEGIKSIKRRIDDLVKESGGMVEIEAKSGSKIVNSIEYDSRRLVKGSLFVAVEGLESDGHDFIGNAVESGAVAVCISKHRRQEFISLKDKGIDILLSEDTRKALSIISAAYYGFPSKSMIIIGITGTNGKTSITYMLESILRRKGFTTGVIGTINYRWSDRLLPAINTTPESKDLQEILYNMKSDNVDIVIMEVSSHALQLNRVDDIEFNTAIFTNLTRDHLDFHKNFDDYFRAKQKLFHLLEKVPKHKKCGIVNIDDEYGEKMFQWRENFSYPVMSFGIESISDYMPDPDTVNNTIAGLSYKLERPEAGVSIDLRLSGKFHVYNSLAAIAAAHQLDLNFDLIREGLAGVETVPGRFEAVKCERGFNVIIDYAHTVDALLKLLQSANELEHSKVITVFGCGGDRDRTKRPLMGEVAEENSDFVIVTSDNPRTENPDDIIREIIEGLEGDNYEIVPGREEAIKRAIAVAKEGDIVVIAGKGHEDYQIIGTEKIHFDDKEIAAKYI